MRHRTALITAGSIALVVFAGAIAVGANLGILTVADSAPAGVGQLTAATVVKAGVKVADPTRTTNVQKYVIKKAGSVKVAFSKKNVRLVDVSPRSHWTWKLTQTGDQELTVAFAHGSDTYTFKASLDKQHKLTAKVDHPVTKVTTGSSGSSVAWVAAPAPSQSHSSDGEGEGESEGSYESEGADD